MTTNRQDRAIDGAAGQAAIRISTPEGREARKAELLSPAEWYVERGDAETAADYRAQAERLG